MPGDNRRASPDPFIQRVREAALQLLFMQSWEYDRQLERNGWKTFFAADADIVTMYGSPGRVAQSRGARVGYSEVFVEDSKDRSVAIAERLADHVFFNLSPEDVPLLVLPPIDSEVRSILEALMFRIGAEPGPLEIDSEQLAEFSRILEAAIGKTVPQDVLDSATRLVGLRGESAQTEYRRLNQVLAHRRVIPIHSMDPDRDGFSGELFEVIAKFGEVSDWQDHEERARKWLQRIIPSPHGGRISNYRRSRFIRDADAMAFLEILNERLAKSRNRVLYITGAMHLVVAGISFSSGGSNFFSRYIRHPRYFLASPEVVVGAKEGAEPSKDRGTPEPEGGRSQFPGWLETFTANCRIDVSGLRVGEGGFDLDTRSKHNAAGAHRLNPDLGMDLQQKWGAYLERLSLSYVPPETILAEIQKDLLTAHEKNAMADWIDVRNRLESQVEDEKERAWEVCFESAVKAGFFFQARKESESLSSPHVPISIFSKWMRTKEFVESMRKWKTSADVDLEEYDRHVLSVKNEAGGDYLYAFYLAHAAFFAAQGNWKTGAIVSVKAAGWAHEPDPARNEEVGDGREANYLAAYCLRHEAKTIGDLEVAEAYLDNAIRIHGLESLLNPGLDVMAERFDVEKLAFEMTRMCLFKYSPRIGGPHVSVDEAKIPAKESWLSLRSSFEELRCRVSERGDSGGDSMRWLRLWIEGYICMASLFADDLKGESFLSAGKRLHELLDRRRELRNFYFDSLDLLWKAASGAGDLTRQDLETELGEERILENSVMRYDGPRFSDLRNAAMACLEEHGDT